LTAELESSRPSRDCTSFAQLDGVSWISHFAFAKIQCQIGATLRAAIGYVTVFSDGQFLDVRIAETHAYQRREALNLVQA
jgi:hypothetical protein